MTSRIHKLFASAAAAAVMTIAAPAFAQSASGTGIANSAASATTGPIANTNMNNNANSNNATATTGPITNTNVNQNNNANSNSARSGSNSSSNVQVKSPSFGDNMGIGIGFGAGAIAADLVHQAIGQSVRGPTPDVCINGTAGAYREVTGLFKKDRTELNPVYVAKGAEAAFGMDNSRVVDGRHVMTCEEAPQPGPTQPAATPAPQAPTVIVIKEEVRVQEAPAVTPVVTSPRPVATAAPRPRPHRVAAPKPKAPACGCTATN